MDLEQYRLKHGLNYEELADKLGIGHRRTAQRTALGMQWPQSELLQTIIERCRGVSIQAMHDRRLRFLEERKEQAA